MIIKKLFSLAVAIIMATACDAQTTQLPAPSFDNSVPMMQAFASRRSSREYSSRSIDAQTLSNMLWATAGVNRPSDGKRTNPTAMNRQEITVYVFTVEGVSRYVPETHSLEQVVKGDHRDIVAAGQDFVMTAPVSIVFVGDYDKFGMGDEKARQMVAVDAGIACENLCLYCAGVSLATVPRATMNVEAIHDLLHLTNHQEPIMNNSVGYKAE